MIQTLMALWNRGASGRLLVMIVTFLVLCISISLLFVTVGSVWGSLLAHGRPGGNPQTPVSNAVLVTATAPPAVTPTTAPVGVTPTLPANPCLASPTGAHGNTARGDATRNNTSGGVPTGTATSGSLHKTPTTGATMLPQPSPTPSPTLPAVTPTMPVTPTVTPTATTTPGNTPTATLTPTGTSTPGVTPTPMPTVTDTPTATVTPATSPAVTVTAPTGSPTVVISATGGIAGRQVHDGRPQVPGTPVNANNGQTGQGNCLGDALATGGEIHLLSRLQDFFWVILVSSLLGTMLFCAQMYRLSRKARG